MLPVTCQRRRWEGLFFLSRGMSLLNSQPQGAKKSMTNFMQLAPEKTRPNYSWENFQRIQWNPCRAAQNPSKKPLQRPCRTWSEKQPSWKRRKRKHVEGKWGHPHRHQQYQHNHHWQGHRMCTSRSGSGVVEHQCCHCIAHLDVMLMSLSSLLMLYPCMMFYPFLLWWLQWWCSFRCSATM